MKKPSEMTWMVHPFIQTELEAQKRASKGLPPLLEEVSKKMGVLVSDLAPEEVSVGRVVSQNEGFTVQQTKNGEIVTHDNRRLEAIPMVGAEITVSYYKGSGQVVETLENVKASAPFIDRESGDLAIQLTDSKGREQMVLFNSFLGFDKFLKVHGLDEALMDQAMDARRATPKLVAPTPKRDVVGVYMEVESGCLAIDYTEDGVKYSALFADAKGMTAHAAEFGLSSSQIATARALEVSGRNVGRAEAETAMADLLAKVNALPDVQKIDAPINGRPYTGKVVAASSLHVAQHVGGGNIVVHDLRNLDKVPEDGEMFKVKYTNGRGKVDLARANEGLQR